MTTSTGLDIGAPLSTPAGPPDPAADWVDLLKAVGLIWLAQIVLSIPLFFLGGGSAPEYLEPHQLDPVALLAFGVATAGLTVFILWRFMCKKYGLGLLEGFGITRVNRDTWVQSATIGFVCAVVVGLVGSMVPAGNSYMARLMSTPGGLLVVCFLAVLLPPVEELHYRGFIFPIARKYSGTAVAVTITAVWFTAAHVSQLAGDWLTLPFIFGVALVLTVQRQITGSLTPPMISHWVYNMTLVAATLISSTWG